MRVLFFDGQGSISSSSCISDQPLRSPLATLFVRQVNALFSSRIKSLTFSTLRALESGATRSLLSLLHDSSIRFPVSDSKLLCHPLISFPSLFVSQVIRVFEELEIISKTGLGSTSVVGYSSGLLPALLVATSLSPSRDAPVNELLLLQNAIGLFEVAISLGIESQVAKGDMLSASGITIDDPIRECEWSAVVFGEKRDMLEDKLNAWNAQTQDVISRIHLTAQTTATCHTISGVPSSLKAFLTYMNLPVTRSSTPLQLNTVAFTPSPSRTSSTLSFHSSTTPPCLSPIPRRLHHYESSFVPASNNSPSTPRNNYPISSPNSPSPTQQMSPATIKKLRVFSLFHTNTLSLRAARDRVLSNLFTPLRNDHLTPTASLYGYDNINFNNSKEATHANNVEIGTIATLNSLRLCPSFPLYDMGNGNIISSDIQGQQLIERIVDLILLERVEFATVLQKISEDAEKLGGLEIMNIGPSAGLARTAMRVLKDYGFSSDLTFLDLSTPSKTASNAHSSLNHRESIAIVGMAVNLPGACDTNELWHILENGINTVTEIPESRFSVSPPTNENGKSSARSLKTRFGCFLEEGVHSGFDNEFFRISPREARALDPQMRLVMRVGFQAVESAGLIVKGSTGDSEELTEGQVCSKDIGCFVGVATNDYVLNSRNEIGVHYATGTLPAFLAGRLAFALHFSGPSVVTNTACSSSLVAIHQACRALLAGDCKAALAGGVNVITSPDMYSGLDRAHFLSPSGNCKPWDASADGYCRAEGCGMFVLKRLSDALASSDNILGVIRGSEVNQSAAAVSITRPHGPTQETLLRLLLEKTGVFPEEINLVEAHGTGTQAGDPEELKSIRNVLSPNNGSGRAVTNQLTVTSVKANIGHTEAASGAASLAKVLLMIRHRSIPTQIGLSIINPKIERLEADYTKINTSGSCVEWTPSSHKPRIALINNFGAAGSNAAMLVEEAPGRPEVPAVLAKDDDDHVLVAISADTKEALLRLRDSYMSVINESTFVDFGYTATSRRKIRPWRLSVSSSTITGMKKALAEAQPSKITTTGPEEKFVFVFSGQGGQHIGMGQQLYITSHLFRDFVDSCHEKLVDWGYPGVLSIIGTESSSMSGLEENDELVAIQCSVFVLECALHSLFVNWGIKPSAVVGHSLGEYAALVAADVITLDAGLRLVAYRASLMSRKCQKTATGMLAVRLQAQSICDIVSRVKGCSDIVIACYNGTKDIVVGGPITQLSTLKAYLERSGARSININVPFAYHTNAMDPLLDDFELYARKIVYKAPKIPIVSNVLGRLVQPGDESIFNSRYLAKHCRFPVRFDEGIGHLAAELEQVGSFIELGPHPTTLPMLTHVATSTGANLVHSLHKKSTPRASILSSLSQLFLLRKEVLWGNVYRDLYPTTACIELPAYPLSEKQFWIPYVEESQVLSLGKQVDNSLDRFSFLDSWTQKPSSQDGNISEFETPIKKISGYITGHSVVSFPLCPASVYHELAMSAATCTLEFTEKTFSGLLTFSELQFSHPLVYDPAKHLTIRTTINLHPRGSKHAGTFIISSVLDGIEQNVHCTGFFQYRQKDIIHKKLQLHAENIERSISLLLNPTNGIHLETLRTRTIYDLIFSRVVKYSKLYQVINSMTLDEAKGECHAVVRLTSEQNTKGSISQPIFTDSLLHAAGFLINSQAGGEEAFICNQVDSLKVAHSINYSNTFELHCSTFNASDNLVLADAWAIEVGEQRRVVAQFKRMRFSRLRVSNLKRLLSSSVESCEREICPSSSVSFMDRSFGTPVTPAKLGSPFRPSHRANTPSSMSSITVVNGTPEIATVVTNVLAEACGVSVDDIDLDSNIIDFGVDSLIWIELCGQFKAMLPGFLLDTCELMSSRTVNDLVRYIVKSDQSTSLSNTPFNHSPLDKSALRPSGLTFLPASPSNDSVTSTKAKEIFGNILDIPACKLHDDDTLDNLGLDSLGSIEAMNEIQQQFHISLPCDFFRDYRSIHAVERYISNSLDSGSLSRYSSVSTLNITDSPVYVGSERSLLPLQSSNSDSCPLFLVHDGSGLSHCYSRLGCLNRPLWGISNPKLLSGGRWNGGIMEMAEHYINQMKPIMTEKGCILGGWSFGGVVAFHMACKLIQAGVKVAGVILIDSPSPFSRESLPDEIIDSVLCMKARLNSGPQQDELMRLARMQMSHATQALVNYNPRCLPSLDSSTYPNIVILRCEDSYPLSSAFRMPFLEDRNNPKDISRDWEELTGKKVAVLDIPGHHFEPFSSKNISAVTEQLNCALEMLDTSC